ncbi:unnamed protein product, partial [marine sediment metagenome]
VYYIETVMVNQKVSFRTEKELQEAVLQEKARGTPDLEIGQKYGVTFRYIEQLITKSQGINVSALAISKKIKTLRPKDFREEQTTVWSFKNRGNWATHSGEYRGNWSPYNIDYWLTWSKSVRTCPPSCATQSSIPWWKGNACPGHSLIISSAWDSSAP